MKTLACHLLLVVLLGGFLAGCATSLGPVVAPLTIDMKGPVSGGPAATSPKVGRSEAWGVLFFAMGDASISTAMKSAGITRIHHVDNETMNIFGIYARYTTVVYGE